jgi:hypothetical protein
MSIATGVLFLLGLMGLLVLLGIVEDANEDREAHETMRDDSE